MLFLFTLLGDNIQAQRDAAQAETDHLNRGAPVNRGAPAEQDRHAARSAGADWFAA